MTSGRIQIDRLTDELATLASFSDAPSPAVTRVVFSERDLEARAWLKTLFEAANTLSEAGIGPAAASRPDYVFEPECVAADTLAARLGFSAR